MTNPTNGIFDHEQLNTIRDAHRQWCEENATDPSSPLGQKTASLMLEAFKRGMTTRHDLISACDEVLPERLA